MANTTSSHYTLYELQQLRKLTGWKKKMLEPPGTFNKFSKSLQNRFNRIIPQKVHNAITAVIKKMVEAVLFTSEYAKPSVDTGASLEEREKAIIKRMEYYRTTAAAEGGVTGFGGILAAMADFPALLIIKLKFLFDTAALYGYDTRQLRERIFLLYVFQLAFSSPHRRADTFSHLAFWSQMSQSIPDDPKQFDWYTFQQDYRDYLDLAKLLQMMPGIGAVVGLVVNYRLLNQLSNTAMMCYRMRWLADRNVPSAELKNDEDAKQTGI